MDTITKQLKKELEEMKKNGLYKDERLIYSQQNAQIIINKNIEVLNFCANNYLGLSNHPDLLIAAKEAIDKFGFGLSSVRFICGTQSIHTKLEERISLLIIILSN